MHEKTVELLTKKGIYAVVKGYILEIVNLNRVKYNDRVQFVRFFTLCRIRSLKKKGADRRLLNCFFLQLETAVQSDKSDDEDGSDQSVGEED